MLSINDQVLWGKNIKNKQNTLSLFNLDIPRLNAFFLQQTHIHLLRDR